jgi:hypothetical protein
MNMTEPTMQQKRVLILQTATEGWQQHLFFQHSNISRWSKFRSPAYRTDLKSDTRIILAGDIFSEMTLRKRRFDQICERLEKYPLSVLTSH